MIDGCCRRAVMNASRRKRDSSVVGDDGEPEGEPAVASSRSAPRISLIAPVGVGGAIAPAHAAVTELAVEPVFRSAVSARLRVHVVAPEVAELGEHALTRNASIDMLVELRAQLDRQPALEQGDERFVVWTVHRALHAQPVPVRPGASEELASSRRVTLSSSRLARRPIRLSNSAGAIASR